MDRSGSRLTLDRLLPDARFDVRAVIGNASDWAAEFCVRPHRLESLQRLDTNN
jgi:hypothetical protein